METLVPHDVRPDLEFQRLAEEILITLRGEFSQRELSEKLGFTFNQVGKWESGATKIKWDDFFHLAEALRLPLEENFRRLFYPVFEGEFTPPRAFERITQSTTAKLSLWPAATLRRWLKGESSPLFADVLRVLGSSPGVLFAWLETLVDCTKIPSLREDYVAFQARLELVTSDPTCVYINAALKVQGYKDSPTHDEMLLAEHAACTVEHLRETLRAMVQHGVIRIEHGKYLPCPFDFSFGASRAYKARSLMKSSLNLLASRYSPLPAHVTSNYFANPSMGSIRVVALSKSMALKIAAEITAFNAKIAALVAADTEPKDAVQVIMLNSVPSNINSPIRGKTSPKQDSATPKS